MNQLEHIAQHQPEMSLEQFVAVANELLPQFLPNQGSGSRGQEPVNPRLVRHYTTQGLLDKPLKQGREARYIYRHLLQLLVLRRLLADSYSVGSIADLISGQANEALESILKGGVQLTVEAANPALAFLSQVRDRTQPSRPSPVAQVRDMSPSSATPPPAPAPSVHPVASAPESWTRLSILDGLELHVRADFTPPATAHEREHLLQLIADRLAHLNSSRRSSR